MCPSRTAGISCHPVRAAIRSVRTGFPHHDAMMMSGAAAIERAALFGHAHDAAENAYHLEDLGDAALIEREHRIAALHQFGCDVGLKIIEGEDEVATRSPSPRRYSVGRLLGEADDPAGKRVSAHPAWRSVKIKPSRSTVSPMAIGIGRENIGPLHANE